MMTSVHNLVKQTALVSLRKLYGWRSEWHPRPFRYIIILGHQRTGSSLLTQILCSHPDICGFGESRTMYRSRRDLRSLRGEVFRMHGRFGGYEHYVLDKVLFENLLPDPAIVDESDVQWVFLLRDPIRTMRSMVALFGNGGASIAVLL